LNEDWLPHSLERAGYNRYYVGKFLNAHSVDNYNAPYVKGWTNSSFLLDPFTYEYYNGVFTHNGGPPKSYKGQYSPDLVTEFALDFIEEGAKDDKPFFVAVAPIAPHGNVKIDGGLEFGYPQYAERHAHLFEDYKLPRDAPNFNPKKQGVVSWLKYLPLLNDTVLEYNDGHQRARLRALQAVDEGVERIIKSLEEKDLLVNTYIVYTTDNGYHISSYRLAPGKELPFDTDVHIPLIVRGPGVPRGKISKAVTSHTDLAPTFLKIAEGSRDDFDGLAIPLTEKEDELKRFESVNLEFWGQAVGESKYADYGNGSFDPGVPLKTAADNNTYKGLRLIGEDYSILYTVWCTGEKEYYDTKVSSRGGLGS
jgi:N-acetylglucosamine-6-sulfatase